jgi:outer membrane protein assembly factor BamA
MHLEVRKFLCRVLLLTMVSSVSFAGVVERRKDQFGRDFAYYIFPIAGEIPGMGKATGVGATVSNMGGGDTDFTGYYVRGDIKATGLALLDYHVLPKRLILDVGYNDYMVTTTSYNAGADSEQSNAIYPKVEGKYVLGQMTLTFDERRYEMFVRALKGRNHLIEVLDKNNQAFAGMDTSWKSGIYYTLGGSLDLTDDRLDPRKGARFEFSSRLPHRSNADESEYYVNDFNLTGYAPMRKWDTLVFNLFYSRAHITHQGLTDYATLQQRYGLNCNQYPAGPARNNCASVEASLLAGKLENNRYGTATALGGTQRLRSYDNGRFYAGQALFYGVEYRWNLTDERTPFDIYLAKGIRTGIQLAAFWERGMVANEYNQLFKNGHESYGVGLRVILSGVIIRFDLAQGREGAQTQLFITYPWSMFSVDNPG